MTPPLRLELPEPPSANRYVRAGRGRYYTPDAVKDYRRVVGKAYVAQFRTMQPAFPTGNISLTIEWRRRIKKGDLDNRSKVTLDALSGVCYTDDAQITELHLYRRDDKANPGCTVTIQRAAA